MQGFYWSISQVEDEMTNTIGQNNNITIYSNTKQNKAKKQNLKQKRLLQSI